MLKRFAAWFAAVCMVTAAYAEETPDSDWSYLYETSILREILPGTNAQLAGLGGAGAAVSSGASGMFWNPALIAASPDIKGSLSQAPFSSQRSARLSSFDLSGNLRAIGAEDTGNFGLAAQFEGWTSDPTRNRAIAFGYALPVAENVFVGAAARHESWHLPGKAISAWGMDAGVLWSRELSNGSALDLALAVSNIGARFWDAEGRQMSASLSPLTVRTGAAYTIGEQAGVEWTAAGDLAYVDDSLRLAQDRFRAGAGLEARFWNGAAALRAGYNTAANYYRIGNGMGSVGASAQVGGGRIDYAYLWGMNGLDDAIEGRHLVTMSLQWAGSKMLHENKSGARQPDSEGAGGGLILPGSHERHVRIENSVFSPNGDGKKDAALFHLYNLPQGAKLEIRSSAGALQEAFDLSDRPESVAWNADGAPDGAYNWAVIKGLTAIAEGTVKVDTTAPTLRIDSTPIAFANGESPVGKIAAHAEELNALHQWTVELRNSGAVVHSGNGDTASVEIPLDALKPGARYALTFAAEDEAGNRAEISRAFAALDLRGADAWIDGGRLLVDMPEAAFNEGRQGLNARGAQLAGELSLAIKDGLHVEIGTGGGDPGLSKERADELLQYMTVFGSDPKLVRSGAPSASRPVGAPVRLAVGAAELSAPPAPAAQPNAYRVLAGSFKNAANAERAKQALDIAGFPAVVENRLVDSGSWYRVLVGRFDERNEAEAARLKIRSHVESEPIILSPEVP